MELYWDIRKEGIGNGIVRCQGLVFGYSMCAVDMWGKGMVRRG